jgi:hypothetical protein
MKIPHSYSQIQQDRFVFELLVKSPSSMGTFLDVGCSHPIEINNTYALELLGWRGVLMDLDPGMVELCRAQRKSRVVAADAKTFDWRSLRRTGYDYLSLDVDEGTEGVVRDLLASGLEFRVATIEHDFYRFGAGPRQQIRDLMQAAGYVLLLGDLSATPGFPMEDWWVHASISKIMFDLTPYLTKDTTILPAIPCIPCGQKRH